MDAKSWSPGEKKTIGICESYKYLGEIIMRKGKNEENHEARFEKTNPTVRATNTRGRSMIVKKIEMKLIIQLHEAVTLPTLLYNAETWHYGPKVSQIDALSPR